MKLKIAVCFILICCLSGCGAHHRHRGHRGGYSDMALAHDIYKISFKGKFFTSRDKAQDYALIRCAEVTLREGYRYFIVMNANDYRDQINLRTPATINTYGSSTYSAGYGNFHAVSSINPGTVYEINKYESIILIKLLKSNKNYPFAFEAETILNNSLLRGKHI